MERLAGGRHGGDWQGAARVAGCDPAEILDFSASLNPLGPPPSVLRAIAQARAEVCRYPDPQSRQLRRLIANYYNLDSDWIMAGNGAAELFTWGLRECSQIGPTLIPVPAFRDYDRALDTWDGRREYVSFWPPIGGEHSPQGFRDVIALIEARLEEPDPPACIVLTNPHNPSGQLWPVERLLPLLSRFQLVIVDEAFMDFVCSPAEVEQHRLVSLLSWIQDFPNVVVVRSLTKFFAIAGIRVGFAVGHPDHLNRWQQWRDPWSVNGLATVVTKAALADQGFERRSRKWLFPARRVLEEGLAKIPGFTVFPSAANFLLVRTESHVASLQHQLLSQRQILIRDCTSFGPEGEFYFRVAVRTLAENQGLLAAIKECQSPHEGRKK